VKLYCRLEITKQYCRVYEAEIGINIWCGLRSIALEGVAKSSTDEVYYVCQFV